MTIKVTKISKNKFKVVIKRNVVTTHTVSVSDSIHRNFTKGRISKEQFVKKSFLFLLQREPNTSILSDFDIEVIEKYFPEYKNIGEIGWIDVVG
ncbi:MAG: hypothetical protein VYE27_03010 [Pseudomonadota bacterium]|nr:hypothetical protein [Pseudomonadota bacterium]